MKVVVNRCYGGFRLSKEAYKELGLEWDGFGYAYRNEEDYPDGDHAWRASPKLVEVVERLGKAADGVHAQLAIVEIPDDVEWTIEEYDGQEWVWVSEKHRTW